MLVLSRSHCGRFSENLLKTQIRRAALTPKLRNLVHTYAEKAVVDLNFRSEIPGENKTSGAIVILHGLFGSARNWGAHSRAFARNLQRPVYTLDLRNHGSSEHALPMTYTAMARDVINFFKKHSLTDVALIGHSMGGKVAMSVALDPTLDKSILSKLVVVDIAPSKGQLSNEFKNYDPDVCTFLLTNLVTEPEASHFRIPVDLIGNNIGELGSFPYDPEHTHWAGDTLFVKGSKSSYINRHNIRMAEKLFPAMKLETLEAGHWGLSVSHHCQAVHLSDAYNIDQMIDAMIKTPGSRLSQYRNIVIFEKRNIRDRISGRVAGASRLVASPDSQATFQGSGSYVVFDWGRSPLKLDDSCQPARLQNWDRIQTFHVPRATGLLTQTVGQQRGGFRFLTIVSASADPLTISNISLAITFMPHWDDLRAYPGYFFAPDPGFHDIDCLTKIWHYRVQTNTIPPHTARQEPCPAGGGWSNDALGGAATGPILVDGAKRDRNIWPGDCGISTHTELVALSDMEPTKNSLMVMFRTQNLTTGALQYSGPPLNNQGSDTYISWSLIGTHNYFLYTGDLDFIKSVWANYTKAVGFLEGQVDLTGLMNVSSALSNDWGRASGAGHNSAANALLYRTLVTTADLATHLGNVSLPATYLANATKIKTAFNSLLWDAAAGRFRSNDLPRSIHPQDGNALAVLYNLTTSDAQNKAVSAGLMKFWTPIRPWLRAHFVAGKGERAIDLIEREWGYMLETNLSVKSPLLEGFSANGSLGRLPGVLIIASII
ncbi:unnamed protein product [Mycena citricolor]|uniref:Alpha/beta-hydrolase n=1 Tax=Mycena citricolor TaxID=2018698 RepID=A0AAD2HI03_9AGAR|nr:unnamed protein product [Mycena citricolor]